MSYSDYGGYAFRDGVRVPERSDFTLLPDGESFGTPGVYPAFVALAGGASSEEAKKVAAAPHYHAVLGDGPIFVGLYKQSTVMVHRAVPGGFEKVSLPYDYLGVDGAEHRESFTIDGHAIDIVYTNEDNYYVYARLVQSDGTVWTGFSGYGVGAGLEDCGYGYSTDERVEMLNELFGGRNAF